MRKWPSSIYAKYTATPSNNAEVSRMDAANCQRASMLSTSVGNRMTPSPIHETSMGIVFRSAPIAIGWAVTALKTQ